MAPQFDIHIANTHQTVLRCVQDNEDIASLHICCFVTAA